MSDEYGFREIVKTFLREQAERFKAELAAGATAEREEEICAWFAFQEMREPLSKGTRQREERDPLVDLPRPSLLN